MKKFLVMLLAAMMCLSLVACGKKDGEKEEKKEEKKLTDEEAIVGKWVADLDVGDMLISALTEEEGSADAAKYFEDAKCVFHLQMEFTKDGKATASVADFDKSYVELCDSMGKGIVPYMLDMFKAEGMEMTEEDLLSALGISDFSEFIQSMFPKEELEAEIGGDSLADGTYYLKDGRIFVDTEDEKDETGMAYELASDTLKLDFSEESEASFEPFLEDGKFLAFKRK